MVSWRELVVVVAFALQSHCSARDESVCPASFGECKSDAAQGSAMVQRRQNVVKKVVESLEEDLLPAGPMPPAKVQAAAWKMLVKASKAGSPSIAQATSAAKTTVSSRPISAPFILNTAQNSEASVPTHTTAATGASPDLTSSPHVTEGAGKGKETGVHQSATKSIAESVPETQGTGAHQSATKSIAESVTETHGTGAHQSATKSIAESATETQGTGAHQSVTKSIAESVPETQGTGAHQSATKSIAESVPEKLPEKLQDTILDIMAVAQIDNMSIP